MAAVLPVKDVLVADFKESVIEESFKRPVVVDFWAAWCGPCRILGPVLEKLALEFGGRFLLAKIDTEANPELAARFGIRSIPNVKVFKAGQVVDEFLGAISETEARSFLRSYCPDAADQRFGEALEHLAREETDAARQSLEEVLRLDATHVGALLELGKVFLSDGNAEAAEAFWNRIHSSADEWEQAQSLKASLQFWTHCENSGGAAACAARAAAEQENLEARYANGCCLVAAGKSREALEEFLFVVSRNKEFQNQAARKAMLTVFSLIGERDPLSEEYRKKLALVLY